MNIIHITDSNLGLSFPLEYLAKQIIEPVVGGFGSLVSRLSFKMLK